MNRHFWHACRRDAAFSFVELMVTIVIAGIAFAAMVPVFVGAQEAASGDIMRNAALQLAQDKLEKVRGLEYDVISTDALMNNTIPNGQFGQTVSWTTGGGGTRTFRLSYVVDLLPVGSVDGREQYKQVTITASWDAPPSPVKPIVLSTMVSKQYAGPQIVKFELEPLQWDEATDTDIIITGPMDLDAWIAPEDISSMNQTAIEANRGYVLFTVSSLNGTKVASQKVSQPVSSGEPAHYYFQWDNLAATDGIYVFQAVAVAGFGSRQQGQPVSRALQFTNHMPPAPSNLTALAGDVNVLLGWTTPGVGDLDHYEIYRSADGGVTYVQIGTATTESFHDVGAVGGITNGVTYSYKVRTVDTESLRGAFTSAVTATPNKPGDTVPPTVPSPLTATAVTGQPTVHLSWVASTDGGLPLVAPAGYIIERQQVSPTPSATWEVLQSQYEAITYDDTTAGWSTTWNYRVRAVDTSGNQSNNATAGPVTTGAVTLRSIEVTNSSSTQTYLWVQNVGTSQWYGTSGAASPSRPATGVWVKKNGNSMTWINLPPGIYQVYFLSSNTWNNANILKPQTVDVGSGNGTASYP